MATNIDIDQDKNNLLTMNRNSANVCLVPMTGAQATVLASILQKQNSDLFIQERNVPCRDTHQKRHLK